GEPAPPTAPSPRAIRALPHVLVFDNSNLTRPYRQIAVIADGAAQQQAKPLPRWFRNVVSNA
ncbi:MAG: hypothetical protein ACC642_07005, partial [Pseudomonadales bacterium]